MKLFLNLKMLPTEICKLIFSYTDDQVLRDPIDEKKIIWWELSLNSNDRAIKLLQENQDKVYWYNLSSNTNNRAIKLLLENKDKID